MLNGTMKLIVRRWDGDEKLLFNRSMGAVIADETRWPRWYIEPASYAARHDGERFGVLDSERGQLIEAHFMPVRHAPI